MRAAITLAGVIIFYPLELLLIGALLRGPWRRYPVIFVYAILELLVAVAEAPTVWAYYHGTREAVNWRVLFYQRGEVVKEVLVFTVVLSLIWGATSYLRSRAILRLACVAGAVSFASVSLFLHYDPSVNTGLWMTPWTRDLSLCATILDIALWLLLLARRQRNNQLLVLSGSLGLQFTGEAIGDALRTLSAAHHIRWMSLTGGVISMIAGFARLAIWARLFWKTSHADARELTGAGERVGS